MFLGSILQKWKQEVETNNQTRKEKNLSYSGGEIGRAIAQRPFKLA